MSLIAREIDFRVGDTQLLHRVSLDVLPGQLHAVIGPNGAGKSTLLKLLTGDLQPDYGSIELNDRRLSEWSARELACLRAVLPQSEQLRFGFSASQVVALGRLYSGQQAPDAENVIVEAALTAVDAADLASRRYPTLSGGERARIQLARVLAQVWTATPLGERYLLLDEPTASLDLAHQHGCLQAVRRFAAGGVGVLAVLHDPNLALAYADRVTLLHHGHVMLSGSPREVLTTDSLRTIYGVDVDILQSASGIRHIAVRMPLG